MSAQPSRTDLVDTLLHPRSIAVLGASDNPRKLSGRPVDYLKRFGYAGRILPVNSRRATVQGLPAHATLDAIDGDIDLAMVMLDAAHAAEGIRACGRRGIKVAIVAAALLRRDRRTRRGAATGVEVRRGGERRPRPRAQLPRPHQRPRPGRAHLHVGARREHRTAPGPRRVRQPERRLRLVHLQRGAPVRHRPRPLRQHRQRGRHLGVRTPRRVRRDRRVEGPARLPRRRQRRPRTPRRGPRRARGRQTRHRREGGPLRRRCPRRPVAHRVTGRARTASSTARHASSASPA